MGVRLEGGARFVHLDDFFRLADEHAGIRDLLGISAATLAKWRSGRTRIPWAAYQLVRERSSVGLAERDSMENFQRNLLVLQLDSSQRRVAYLEAELVKQTRLVDWRCANDPFIDPADPRANIDPVSF